MRKTPHVFIQKFIIPKEIFHLKKKLLHLLFQVLCENKRKRRK